MINEISSHITPEVVILKQTSDVPTQMDGGYKTTTINSKNPMKLKKKKEKVHIKISILALFPR